MFFQNRNGVQAAARERWELLEKLYALRPPGEQELAGALGREVMVSMWANGLEVWRVCTGSAEGRNPFPFALVGEPLRGARDRARTDRTRVLRKNLRQRELLAQLLEEFYRDGRFTEYRLIVSEHRPTDGTTSLQSYCTVATPLRVAQRHARYLPEMRCELRTFAQFLARRFQTQGCEHPLHLEHRRIEQAFARAQECAVGAAAV